MITEATEIRSGSDTTNTITKTRKGVGDRRLAEPCFAMQNAPRLPAGRQEADARGEAGAGGKGSSFPQKERRPSTAPAGAEGRGKETHRPSQARAAPPK